MNFFKSSRGRSNKVSSKGELLAFDLLYQLTYLSAISATGMPRSQIFLLGSTLPCSSSVYLREVDEVARGMNYQYSEACRIVGLSTKEQSVKSLLLRLSSSLATGESEMEFITHETEIQAESYNNAYDRKLESLRKWTDAFAALVVSSVLIIVVAAISAVIYDLGNNFVLGLVAVMVLISFLGVWMIYRTAPQEIKELEAIQGSRNQRVPHSMTIALVPLAFVLGSLMSAFGIPIGWTLMAIAVLITPIGVVARRFDSEINRQDDDIGTFLRVLGTTASSIGTTPTEALDRIDMRSMNSLTPSVSKLHIWLRSRVKPELCWQRFVVETGSELVNRAVRVFMDGVRYGGDAAEVAERSAVLSSRVNYLREKRKLIASTFGWLSIAMHATVVFLLLFVMEIVGGFGAMVQTAGVADLASGGGGSGISTSLGFSFDNIVFLQKVMIPVIIVLSLVNAIAPQVVDGGYAYKLCFYLGGTLLTSGIGLVLTPMLAGMIFNIAPSI